MPQCTTSATSSLSVPKLCVNLSPKCQENITTYDVLHFKHIHFPSPGVMAGLGGGVGDPLELHQDLAEGSAGHLLHLHVESLPPPVPKVQFVVK